jgi:hypothetical protein
LGQKRGKKVAKGEQIPSDDNKEEQRQQQIPFGDGNKKSNSKDNSNCKCGGSSLRSE